MEAVRLLISVSDYYGWFAEDSCDNSAGRRKSIVSAWVKIAWFLFACRWIHTLSAWISINFWFNVFFRFFRIRWYFQIHIQIWRSIGTANPLLLQNVCLFLRVYSQRIISVMWFLLAWHYRMSSLFHTVAQQQPLNENKSRSRSKYNNNATLCIHNASISPSLVSGCCSDDIEIIAFSSCTLHTSIGYVVCSTIEGRRQTPPYRTNQS